MKLVNSKLNPLTISLAAIMALGITACGGSGNSSKKTVTPVPGSNPTPAETATFSDSATWVVNGVKEGETCYDFDSKAEIDCKGVNWDIKFTKKEHSISLWTNSGTSGKGNGAAFGMRDWSQLKSYDNATMINDMDFSRHYKADSTQSVFGENKWYEYNLNKGHQIYPNYKVYLVTSDKSNTSTNSSVQMPVYAMQVTNYYNDAGKGGHITLRYVDTSTPNSVKTVNIDASSYSKWAHVNLTTGETTTADGKWHVALKRTNLKLNGGDSGTGNVGGSVAVQPTGFYDAKGKAIASKFSVNNAKSTLNNLTDTSAYSSDKVQWISDGFSSVLNPGYTGTYPNLDYGWYTYDGKSHKLSAKPESEAQAAFIRSGEGNSYARVWLKDINSTGEWTFEMDIQPVK